jgi:hypothetical protein
VDATDPDVGDELIYVLKTGPSGMVIDALTGEIAWNPDNTHVGSHLVEIEVLDAAGLMDDQTFTLTVSNTNDPPSIISTQVTSATQDLPYSYDVNAADPDGDVLTYSLIVAPPGMAIDAASGEITWIPDNSLVGVHAIVVRVLDTGGLNNDQPFNITVANVNDAPVIHSTPPVNATPGVEYTYAVEAADPDVEELTFALDQAPNGMIINANTGAIRWTPSNSQAGSQAVRIRVEDGDGVAANQQYAVTVAAPLPLEANLGTLDFGQVRVGNMAERIVELTNLGAAPVLIDRVDFTSRLFTLVEPQLPFILEGEKTVALRVEFKAPQTPGNTIEAELTVGRYRGGRIRTRRTRRPARF